MTSSDLNLENLLHWPLNISGPNLPILRIRGKGQKETFQPPSRTTDNDRVRVSQMTAFLGECLYLEVRDNQWGEIFYWISLYGISVEAEQESGAGTVEQSLLHQCMWCSSNQNWLPPPCDCDQQYSGQIIVKKVVISRLNGNSFFLVNSPHFRIISCWNIATIIQRTSTVSV